MKSPWLIRGSHSPPVAVQCEGRFLVSLTRDSVETGKRIQSLAPSNLFPIVDWETYGCGKFLSDSKPLEFQTVARGFETHKVNSIFCRIIRSKAFYFFFKGGFVLIITRCLIEVTAACLRWAGRGQRPWSSA